MVIQHHTKKTTRNYWILIPTNTIRRKELLGLLQVTTLKNQEHHVEIIKTFDFYSS